MFQTQVQLHGDPSTRSCAALSERSFHDESVGSVGRRTRVVSYFMISWPESEFRRLLWILTEVYRGVILGWLQGLTLQRENKIFIALIVPSVSI